MTFLKSVYTVYLLSHTDCYKRADTSATIICAYITKRPALLHAINCNIKEIVENEHDLDFLKKYIENCCTDYESDDFFWESYEKNIEYYNLSDESLEDLYNHTTETLMDYERAEFTMMPSFTAYIVEETELKENYIALAHSR